MTSRFAVLDLGGGPTTVDLLALPKVEVVTAGGAPILNREDYVNATITISYRGVVTTLAGQIRGRGNQTWGAPKKPYRIKLGTAASLVPGVPADKDWVLLANYYDPTAVRTTIAMEIGYRCSGLAWTPRFRHVELTLNGVSLGLYQLGEHVKVGAARVAVDKPGNATTGLALTGGYTLEIDQRMEANGDPGFRTAHDNLPIAFGDPDGSIPQQAAYIETWINSFETALYAADWLNLTTGYARFINRDSFIDWYLVNELTMNHDANFYSSCKLYKTRDTAQTPGRLYMGPLWDFDNSIGNTAWTFSPNTTGWLIREPSYEGVHPGALWLVRMFEDPAFAAAAWARWQPLAATLLADLPGIIDRTLDVVHPASLRDQRTWPGGGAGLDSTKGRLTAWLTGRIAWMTANLEP